MAPRSSFKCAFPNDIHGHKVELLDSAKYLGVTIHKTINWNTHIENISKKARLGPLFKKPCPQGVKPVIQPIRAKNKSSLF